jgi:RNA polymerase sigma factor (sigma-70 family)
MQAISDRMTHWLRTPDRLLQGQEETAGDGQPMSSADTRVSVIVGVCHQDPERWREFDAIYRPMLLSYLCKRGLKEFEANDVVQDIFVKLLGKIHTYDRDRCQFRSWLFGLAHNTLIDRARRRAAYAKALDGWVVHVLRDTLSDSLRMAEKWVKIHRERILEHALEQIRVRTSSKVWACFEQRLLRNRPAAEIAAELKLKPKAVHVYASRVLKRVRAVCHEFDEDISHAIEFDVSG